MSEYDDAFTSGSDHSTGSSGYIVTPHADLPDVLDNVREWFGTYIVTTRPEHLDVLTLWAAHTWLVDEIGLTCRLQLDSPVPGAGKTTVLEHFERLTSNPVPMASISSAALLARIVDNGIATLLIDEADRSLNPEREGTADVLAVLNSGYKKSGKRPVLVPVKGGGWQPQMMSTFSPVVMAGNQPKLPDDVRSRMIRVLLLPDATGDADETDWEICDGPAVALGKRLATWAESVRDSVRDNRPTMPDGIRGRLRERWAPLKRVADAAGGRWPDLIDRLALEDLDRTRAELEEGLVREKPAIVLLRHLLEIWPNDQPFMPTAKILTGLIQVHPEMWGSASPFGKDLTSQRLGRMMVTSYDIHTMRKPDGDRETGYVRTYVMKSASSLGLVKEAPSSQVPTTPTMRPDEYAEPDEPDPLPDGSPRCSVCGYPADPADPDGMCGSDDDEHAEQLAAMYAKRVTL